MPLARHGFARAGSLRRSAARGVLRFRGSRLRVALLVASALAWLPGAATAQCLTGPDATGFEIGTQTLQRLLPNEPDTTLITGVSCMPNTLFVDPGFTANGSGRAEFVASNLGYSLYTGVLTSGETTGSGFATAGGSVRYVVRVEAEPGYAGPSVVDVVITMLFDMSGEVSVSGAGSGGGTFDTDVGIGLAAGGGGAALFDWSQGFVGTEPLLDDATHPFTVGTDYVLVIGHSQSVIATSGQNPSPPGGNGAAASNGTSRISFGVEIDPAFADPLLSVVFPMTDALGLGPPSPGNPPPFPGEVQVPASSAPLLGVLALALAAIAHTRLRAARRRSS